MKRWIGLVVFLSGLFYFRNDFFSINSILGPLFSLSSEMPSSSTIEVLSQPYRYLGKGKQAFAFCSADGKWVVKFFNQNYFKVPFWAVFFSKEKLKREKRKRFYLESYQIAQTFLKEETGITYLHLGPAPKALPHLIAIDKKGNKHRIDLNEVPFVLQKRANAFYPTLRSFSSEELDCAIEGFLSMIASRIEKKICDGDHNIGNNFGILRGKIIQIDPGRLYLEDRLWEPEKLKYEWWSATHEFRKWVEKHHPEKLISFDNMIETNLQRVLQRSQACQFHQMDGSSQEPLVSCSVYLRDCCKILMTSSSLVWGN